MLFVWLGSIFNPSQHYSRTKFEKYKTVSASFDNSNAAVQGQHTLQFQMSSSPASRSQALRALTHPELQAENPTIFANDIPAKERVSANAEDDQNTYTAVASDHRIRNFEYLDNSLPTSNFQSRVTEAPATQYCATNDTSKRHPQSRACPGRSVSTVVLHSQSSRYRRLCGMCETTATNTATKYQYFFQCFEGPARNFFIEHCKNDMTFCSTCRCDGRRV